MILNYQIRRILLIFTCLAGIVSTYTAGMDTGLNLNPAVAEQNSNQGDRQSGSDNLSQELDKLNTGFQASMTAGDTAKSRLYLNSILKNLKENSIDDLTTSDSKYYIGVYYLLSGKNLEAINWFRLSSSIREKMNCYDGILAKCLFNMSIAYNNLGDYNRMEQSALRSHEVEKRIYGESNPLLIRGLSAIVTAYFNLSEYSKAINYGITALKLIEGTNDNIDYDAAILYTNIGTCHARLSDYSKAVPFLEQAESIYMKYSFEEDENYINLLNSLAVTYFFLGRHEKSDEYFTKGLTKIRSSNSVLSFNFLNSFAIMLGNAGNISRGEKVLLNSLDKAGSFFGKDSRDYFEVVKNYADYLRIYKIDLVKSLHLYEKCIIYLATHKEDTALSNPVYLGYALALSEKGESLKSLEIIQKLLFSGTKGEQKPSSLGNPEIDIIKPEQWSIRLLKAKYTILWDIYIREKNDNFLLAASKTSELIISLLDKLRLNISEDESRLLLGDRFRDSYLYSIRNYDLCYKATGNKAYLDKVFEYSERSKVAGLLASTRELKATQFHIPSEIAELERSLKSEVSFYNAKISEENSMNSPDQGLLTEWKGLLINATQKRDSLISLFENQYPEYYLIKYSTGIINPEEIPEIAGRNINYLNYVVSDTVLYIVLANRKHLQLLTVPVDSVFFSYVREFRNLLSFPHDNAKSGFSRFMEVGGSLYKIIFEPVRQYLISNKLLISPDGILSYIPFEALPMNLSTDGNILYSDVSFLMNQFRISYTYSATLLSEARRNNNSLSNSLIAFAPAYLGSINIDTLLKNRQSGISVINDLPFARVEAEFVTNMTGGTLFINDDAKESVFKSEAGQYDIIHLAMHTVLNDQYPMHSKMLFYQEKDSVDDGNLNTYEVYGIPLKAKMVMLSSCNTGNGILHSGEGIMSLARGFVYSGSQSVVMSMWEIEDRSGTEIVKNFYRFLKRGASKSNALRKARIKYLRSADMLRSHPYFWSSLVIYGNNEPLYFSRGLTIIISAILVLIASILILNRR